MIGKDSLAASMPIQRVLLVEDNPGDAELLGERLTEAPYAIWDVRHETTLASALEYLLTIRVDAVILDLNLPDSRGLATLQRIRAVAGNAPIAVVSGLVDEDLRERTLLDGAADVIAKDEANHALFAKSILYLIQRARERDRQERLHLRLEATPDGVIVANLDGAVQFVNEAAVLLLGRSRADIFNEPISLPARGGKPTDIVIKRTGGDRVCEMRVVDYLWNDAPALLASLQDVTERRRIEDALRLSEQRLRQSEAHFAAAQRIAAVGSFVRDLRNDTVAGTSQFYKIYGFDTDPPADWATYWESAVSPSEHQTFAADLMLARQGIRPPSRESSFRRNDGARRVALGDSEVVFDAAGHPVALLGVVRDITDARLVDARIRLLQSASLAIAEADGLETALKRVLRLVCETAGWCYAEAWVPDRAAEKLLLAASWHQDDPALTALAHHAHGMAVERGVDAVGLAWQSRRPEWLQSDDVQLPAWTRLRQQAKLVKTHAVPILGDIETLAVLAFALRDSDDQDAGLVETINAVAVHLASALTRKRAEDAQRKAAGLLEAAMTVAELGTWIIDLQSGGGFQGNVEWSREIYRITGVAEDQFCGTNATFRSLVHPDDRSTHLRFHEQIIESGIPRHIEHRLVRPDGAIRWVRQSAKLERNAAGQPVRLLGVMQDITKSHLLGEQLRHAQKMEAIGTLTGGMAHDFNNLLGVIIGNLDLVTNVPPEVAELIEEAIGASLRGAELTRSLLAFSRRQPLSAERVIPDDVIANAARLLRRVLGGNIEIVLEGSPASWPVLVDPALLEACLVNLATNARDAMPHGGRLVIATENRYLDADYAATCADVTQGEYVGIEVSDNGSGMSPEVIEHVFEPFFTTKRPGEGTGLGLSMVFGFIKQSGGHITVYSEVGLGTTFRLYLPRAIAEQQDKTAAAPSDPEPLPARGERILVVEDNAALRRIVVNQLMDLGYRTFDADGPASALKILDSETVDLLFTDIIMPGPLDGFAFARQAMSRWPGLKVALTSGFSGANLHDERGLRGSGVRLISKPYRKGELARMLREVIDG